MDVAIFVAAGLTVYKISCLLVGLASIYMGYRLFMAGVISPAGNIAGQGGGIQLSLGNAAPGTFFALFGAFVIGLTVHVGLEFKQHISALPGYEAGERAPSVSAVDELESIPEELEL